ncbi:MAG: hypothetical protein COB53_04175 [Elusimicrobia bacterium]|nr:MAG: hypothetical protein COB53_04175 [Elusimicrobiota bacterium]
MAFSTVIRLEWLKSGAPARKGFRLPGSGDLYEEYTGRIGRYCSFATKGADTEGGTAGVTLWACDPRGRTISSEQLAQRLREARDGGVKGIEIVIGGPDGLSQKTSNAAFKWSFGPMTLPHELAAVVAAEQIYRAWTILGGEPYHLGH